MDCRSGFYKRSKFRSHDFGVNASNSNVNVYPSAHHNPIRQRICITKDASINSYYRPIKKRMIETTGTNKVDDVCILFKIKHIESSCKYNANYDYMI